MKVLTQVFREICEWKEISLQNFCLSTGLPIVFKIAFRLCCYLSVRFFFCFKSLIILVLDPLCDRDYTSAEEEEPYS